MNMPTAPKPSDLDKNKTQSDLDKKTQSDETVEPYNGPDRTNLSNESKEDREARKNPLDTESADEKVRRLSNGEIVNDPHEGSIVFRQLMNDGSVKEQGPVRRSAWTAYSLKNGL